MGHPYIRLIGITSLILQPKIKDAVAFFCYRLCFFFFLFRSLWPHHERACDWNQPITNDKNWSDTHVNLRLRNKMQNHSDPNSQINIHSVQNSNNLRVGGVVTNADRRMFFFRAAVLRKEKIPSATQNHNVAAAAEWR